MPDSYESVVLKVGGSIITDKYSDSPQPDRRMMQRAAEEITSFDDSIVLVHGSGSYGHPAASNTGLWTGITSTQNRQDFARIQRLQNELNCIFTSKLQEAGIPAFPAQPSTAAMMVEGRLDNFYTKAICPLISQGIVPVLFGVPAYDEKKTAAVLSGDVLAAAMAQEIDADIVLHATDVDGVYDRTPAEDNATKLDRIESFDSSVFSPSARYDASGGMENKVRSLFEYEQQGHIFSGTTEGNIRDALDGETFGSVIAPQE